MKHIAILLLPLIGTTSLPSGADTKPDAAAQFVTVLKDAALNLFEKMPNEDEARTAEVCKLIDSSVDLEKMANFSLGRLKSKFSTEQQTEFNQVFRSMLASIFDLAFQRLQNSEVLVDPVSKALEDGYVVNVTVEPKNNRSPSRLQFFVSHPTEEKYLLFDASLNGLRIMLAKRAEFEGVINDAENVKVGSGRQGLIDDLRQSNTPCP